MTRYFITGAAGFIGSSVGVRLLGEGHEVAGFDNFDPYYARALKDHNIELLRAAGNFSLVTGDLRDRGAVIESVARAAPEVVIHIAAKAGVRPSIQDPQGYHDVNVMGTLHLFDACKAAGVKNVVFASSSSVYGDESPVPFDEASPCDRPLSPYAATKRAGELLAHTYAHLHGMNITCLRFFTVYGPRQRPEMAIAYFTRLIDQGKAVPIFGDGNSERDYTYVDDIVDGVLAAACTSHGFRVFNLGNSATIPLTRVVTEISTALGKPALIERLPPQPGDARRTCASIQRAREALGYNPQTPFRDGVRKYVSWYLKEGRKLEP
ncbi:MAG: UDP-glucose 4-epimerase [Myxococcota bacterium]|nr:UDP-glucose 4-epimerase [Myxococcota bacterium]